MKSTDTNSRICREQKQTTGHRNVQTNMQSIDAEYRICMRDTQTNYGIYRAQIKTLLYAEHKYSQ